MAVDLTDGGSPASRESGLTVDISIPSSVDSSAEPDPKRAREEPHTITIGTQAYQDLEATAARVPDLTRELKDTAEMMLRERTEMVNAVLKLKEKHVAELEEAEAKYKKTWESGKVERQRRITAEAEIQNLKILLREAEKETEEAQAAATTSRELAETTEAARETAQEETYAHAAEHAEAVEEIKCLKQEIATLKAELKKRPRQSKQGQWGHRW